MTAPLSMPKSERWLSLLLHLYPADFRDEFGRALVEAYLDRCRNAARRAGAAGVAVIWLRALVDSLRNGLGERLRPGIAWRRAGNWGRDAELAVRRLTRAPVFSLAMIGTLVVGLGAFAVVLTVVQKVLIEPLPYERPNDLYFVWRDYRAFFDLQRGWLGGPDVAELAKAGGPIADAVGLRRDRRTLADPRGGDGNPEEIGVMVSSPNLFDVLGVRPIVGRGFAPSEVGPDRSPVIVLGYDLWQRRFAGDRGVIGTTVRVNGELFTVIGVTGRDFHFVRHNSLGSPEGADAYITFAYQLASTDSHNGAFAGLVRARPGASPATVAAAVASVGRSIDERDFKGRGLKLYPVGLRADLVGSVRPALVVLGLSGVFLVLVLAANLATLLLGRAAQREREFAVSRALGASPLALVRATLVEAGLLGAIGGAGAALVAVWGTRALVALAPIDLPRRDSIAVDWRIAAMVIGVGALVGLVAGAAPAVWASRSTLGALLRNAAVRGGGGGNIRRPLVVVQVALCLVLLSTGGLVARSFEHLLRSQPGFDPTGALTFRVPIAQWRYPDNASATALHARLERELAAVPGVVSVGAGSALPLTANTDQTDVRLPGAPGNTGKPEHDAPLVDVPQARAGYFRALGIRILAGRDFGPVVPGAPREAIIDRTLAAEFYPSGNAVGAKVVLGGDTLSVVGVVDHARQYDLHRDGRPQVYLRDQDDTYGALYFVLRTRRDPLDLVPDVRAVVRRLDTQLAISEVRALEDVVAESTRQQRLSAVLVAGFSAGALLLAAMGLYGVISSAVSRRRHEIAVRLALGADRGGVLRMVLREGAVLVAVGVVVAVPGIYVAGRALRGTLVGISPFDPTTLGVVGLGLGVVALVACYVPARRASLVEPAGALREG
jgi:putative ABC transport system permease protein